MAIPPEEGVLVNVTGTPEGRMVTGPSWLAVNARNPLTHWNWINSSTSSLMVTVCT
jgi:hypothetical protein